jgi:hypothetical protein
VDEDGEVEGEDPDRRLPEEDDIPEEQRLPDDDRREGHVNRVPQVPVHASHDEVTRRIPPAILQPVRGELVA